MHNKFITLVLFLALDLLVMNTSSLYAKDTNFGLFIDPSLGYASIAYDSKDNDDSNDWKGSGAGFGLKAGLNYYGLITGGVFDYAKTEAKNKADAETKQDLTYSSYGLFLGYSGSLFSIWYSHYLKSKLKWDNYQSNPTQTAIWELVFGPGGIEFSGKGWGLGLGVKIIEMVQIFAEVKVLTYSKIKASGGIYGTEEQSISNAGSAYYLLGVSFPLTF